MPARCPHCFFPLHPSLSAFRCGNEACATGPDEVASAFAGYDVTGHVVSVLPSQPAGAPSVTHAYCSACGEVTGTEVCPRCHWTLPAGWRETETTCIAAAGARATGKSIYLGVAKKQLELLAEAMGTTLGYADDASREVFSRYYEEPLFEQRQIIRPTAVLGNRDAYQRQPLVLTLGTLHGRPHRLVLRDVAGEDLENRPLDSPAFAFLRDADAVLFLVDPLKVVSVRQQLHGLVPEPEHIGADPLFVLDRIATALASSSDAGPVRVPLALVLSKFDTLQLLAEVQGSEWQAVMSNPGAAFNRERPPETPSYDQDDAELLGAEVASLLVRLRAQPLLNRARSGFAECALFAVSALGSPPVAYDRQSPRGIAPFRCLDPLRWVLARSGWLV